MSPDGCRSDISSEWISPLRFPPSAYVPYPAAPSAARLSERAHPEILLRYHAFPVHILHSNLLHLSLLLNTTGAGCWPTPAFLTPLINQYSVHNCRKIGRASCRERV